MKKKVKTKKSKTTPSSDDRTSPPNAGEPKKGRPATVDYGAFVRAWSTADSVGAAAAALGIKRNSASSIAARLRKEGVNLRSFPRRGSQPIDVKRLNKIAAGKDA